MSEEPKKSGRQPGWGGLTVTSLEADVAYFDARLSLIGDVPETAHQKAQIKTYQALVEMLGDSLKTMKRGKTRRAS